MPKDWSRLDKLPQEIRDLMSKYNGIEGDDGAKGRKIYFEHVARLADCAHACLNGVESENFRFRPKWLWVDEPGKWSESDKLAFQSVRESVNKWFTMMKQKEFNPVGAKPKFTKKDALKRVRNLMSEGLIKNNQKVLIDDRANDAVKGNKNGGDKLEEEVFQSLQDLQEDLGAAIDGEGNWNSTIANSRR